MIPNNNFSFDGVTKPYILAAKKERPVFAPVKRNLLYIPGMPGAHLESTDTEVRIQPVTVWVDSEGYPSLQKLKEDMADWLIHEKEKELIFEDETDRTYYAVVDGSLDLEEIVTAGVGTITFICPDPYKYGDADQTVFTSELAVLTNKGTAETYPTFRATVKEPITFLDIAKNNAYMRIGEPIYEGMVPTKPYDRILVDSFASMVGWGALTDGSVLPDGIVGGSMKTTGGSFEADLFGANPNGWVGPAVKKSFSEPLQDFAIDLEVTSRNTQGFTGKLQAAFLDASNNVVMSMALMDGAVGVQENRAIFKLGERTILNEKGSNHGSYNNETLHLNFTRKGQEITAYVYKQTGDVRDGRIREVYKDLLNEYQTPITQIVVYIAKYKEYSTFPMSFNHLIVDKLYSLSEMQIPYIANPGDIIEIDHSKNRILINGEDKKDLKDFGASFFPLDKGDSVIQVSPFASLEQLIAEWRAAFR